MERNNFQDRVSHDVTIYPSMCHHKVKHVGHVVWDGLVLPTSTYRPASQSHPNPHTCRSGTTFQYWSRSQYSLKKRSSQVNKNNCLALDNANCCRHVATRLLQPVWIDYLSRIVYTIPIKCILCRENVKFAYPVQIYCEISYIFKNSVLKKV